MSISVAVFTFRAKFRALFGKIYRSIDTKMSLLYYCTACSDKAHKGAYLPMDELDRKIIALLQLDGRASNAKIAREVGVSEGTVRRRLRKLLDDDVVRVVAVPNLEKLGFSTTALIGMQTGPGKSDVVAESLINLPEAHYVAVTTGAYDVFVWAGLESAESLGQFLRSKIGPIDGVQRTETFVNLSIKKRTYGLVL